MNLRDGAGKFHVFDQIVGEGHGFDDLQRIWQGQGCDVVFAEGFHSDPCDCGRKTELFDLIVVKSPVMDAGYGTGKFHVFDQVVGEGFRLDCRQLVGQSHLAD